MSELILHLIGDYCTQNHTMANRKTASWFWAALHVTLYMLPFLLLTRSPAALAVMAGTHLVIDRFRLAKYWTAFWGVGCEGYVAERIRKYRAHSDFYAKAVAGLAREPARFATHPVPAPDWLAVWLLIIVDNTFHLAINHLSLLYL